MKNIVEERYKDSVVKKIKAYMKKNNVLEVEIKGNKVLTLEPVKNCDRAFFLDIWLKGELSTDKLEENMRRTHWYVQYYLDDFLREIEVTHEKYLPLR